MVEVFVVSFSQSMDFYKKITDLTDIEILTNPVDAYWTESFPPLDFASMLDMPYLLFVFDKCVVDEFALLQLRSALDSSNIPRLATMSKIPEDFLRLQSALLNQLLSGVYGSRISVRDPSLLSYMLDRLEEEKILKLFDTSTVISKHVDLLRSIIKQEPNQKNSQNPRNFQNYLRGDLQVATILLASLELNTPLYDQAREEIGWGWVNRFGSGDVRNEVERVSVPLMLSQFLRDCELGQESRIVLDAIMGLERKQETRLFKNKLNDRLDALKAKSNFIYYNTLVSSTLLKEIPIPKTKADIDRILSMRYDRRFESYRNKVNEVARRIEKANSETDRQNQLDKILSEEFSKIPLRDMSKMRKESGIRQYVLPVITASSLSALGLCLKDPALVVGSAAVGAIIKKLADEFDFWSRNHQTEWHLFIEDYCPKPGNVTQ